MLQSYDDIKSKINEKPKWYDEKGVPRYCEFHPDRVNNIYAREVILLWIECQNCSQKFKVAMSQGTMQIHKFNSFKDKDYIHYGDPPRHNDNIGETMNCIDLEILEYWEQGDLEWERRERYEGKLDNNELITYDKGD